MKSDNPKKYQLICPECDNCISENGNIHVGRVIECERCATESEILSLEPLKLAPLEEEK